MKSLQKVPKHQRPTGHLRFQLCSTGKKIHSLVSGLANFPPQEASGSCGEGTSNNNVTVFPSATSEMEGAGDVPLTLRVPHIWTWSIYVQH